MTAHDHKEIREGCYRCELNEDELRESLRCPFAKDQSVVVPRGSRTWRRGEWRRSKRTQTVKVWNVFHGYRDPYTDKIVPPKISWAGAGGYWVDAVVDDELLAANDL